MADLQKIVDDLSSLTVLEAAELAKLLEEKWGGSAATAGAVAGPVRGAGRQGGRGNPDPLYTRMCGDSKGCPSNLHDCRPIWGRQHESTAGGGNGSVSAQAVGRQAISGFCSP